MGDSNLISLSTAVVKSHAAFIQWQPTSLTGQAFLLLTDRALVVHDLNVIAQNSGNSSIKKHQLTPLDLLNGGSYLFDNLAVGEYMAQLIVLSGASISKSNPLQVTVYDDVSVPVVTEIISGDEKITFVMETPAVAIDRVNFILFSQDSSPINVSLEQSSDNRYVLNASNGIVNYRSYETLIMYVVGSLSSSTETFLVQSSNYPNKVTGVTQEFAYLEQKYNVYYTLPNDFSDYQSESGLRLTIKVSYVVDGTTVNENMIRDFTLVGLASQQQLVSFSPSDTFTSGNSFPVDTPFTIQLAMINSYGTGIFSDPMSSILAENFSANQAIISSVVYNNKDTFSAVVTNGTVDSDYDVKIKLEITDNDDVNNKVVVDDYKNEVINSLTIGKTYNSVLSVYLVSKADSSIVFGPSDTATLHNFKFILYTEAAAPVITIDYLTTENNTLTRFMWPAFNLGGLPLEKYNIVHNSVAHEVVSPSVITISSVEYNYIDVENPLGVSDVFAINAVTKYVLNDSDLNGTLVVGNASSEITYSPWKTPLAPSLVSRLPGEQSSTVTISLNDLKGGALDKFLVNVNNSLSYSEKTFTYNTVANNYTAVFNDLTNDISNSIKIKVQTANTVDANLSPLISEPLTVTTFPFVMPNPLAFRLVPEEGSVRLITPVLQSINGDEIITKIYYKSNLASDYLLSTNSWTGITIDGSSWKYSDIAGLTNSTLYDFKTLLVLHNTESDTDYVSAYSDVRQSTPIHHTTAPDMVIVRENQELKVTLTKSDDNFVNVPPSGSVKTTFKYSATAYDRLENNTKGSLLQTLSSVTNLNSVVFSFAGQADYIIEAHYEMYNVETDGYYRSDNTTNSEIVFSSDIFPELSGVEGNGSVALSWSNVNMLGLTIKGTQLKINNGEWVDIETTSTFVPASSPDNTSSYTQYNYVATTTNGDINNFVVRFVVKNPAYIDGTPNTNIADVVYSANSNEVTKQSYSEPPAPIVSYTIADNGDVTINLSNTDNYYGGLPFVRYEIVNGETNVLVIGNTVTYSPSVVGDLIHGVCRTIVDNSVNIGLGSILTSIESLFSVYAYAKLLPVDLFKLIVDSSGQDLGDHDEYNVGFDFDPENNIKLGGRSLSGFSAKLKVKGAEDSTMVSEIPIINATTGHYNFSFYHLSAQVYELFIKTTAINENTGSNDVVDTEIYEFSPYGLPIMKGLTSTGESTAIVMNWTAPNLLNGTFVKYQVTKESGDAATWIDILDINVHTYTFSSLVNGQEYTLRARVVTDKGTGASESTSMTPYVQASAPNVTFAVVSGNVVLSWVQAENNSSEYGGLNLDKFQVQIAGGSWIDVAKTLPGNTITYTAVGLTNGVSLHYKVRSVTSDTYHINVLGSTWDNDITSFVIPNIIATLRVKAYNGQMNVVFSEPVNTNSGITNIFKYAIADTAEALAVLNKSLTSGIVSDDNIDIRTRGNEPFVLGIWTAFVDPNNASNLVFSSTSFNRIVVNTQASNIYNLTYVLSNVGEATLSWKDDTLEVGVSKYNVFLFNEDGTRDTLAADLDTLSYVKSGLVNGTLYRFGVSKDGFPEILQVLVLPMSAPTIISVSKSVDSVLSLSVDKGGDTKVKIMVIANNTNTGDLQFFDATITSDLYSVNVGAYDKFIIVVTNSFGYIRTVTSL